LSILLHRTANGGEQLATDLQQIVREVGAFIDLRGRRVMTVGSGGGQLVDYSLPARHVIAVDRDAAALERLAARLREGGYGERFTLLHEDFPRVDERADVLIFEFCLHEIAEPGRALEHAAGLALDVVVLDHAPHSRWAWYAAEEVEMAAAWAAVEERPVRSWRAVDAEQSFVDYSELAARLAAQPPLSRERTLELEGRSPIVIPMPYRLALLSAPRRGGAREQGAPSGHAPGG
jgi:SAM-dependent methyltransferase